MKHSMKKLQNLEDAVLIVLYQSGKNNVLPILVKRWHMHFCKYAYWYCKDAQTAKDIAQESWLVIYKKLYDLKEPERFKSWAISIANHKAIDWIRKSNREKNKLHKFYDETPKVEIIEKVEQYSSSVHQKMKNEIAKLPQHQQVVLRLFYIEEYSLKQIGGLLEISVGTAKSRLFHARERLKKQMRKYKNE